MEYLFILGRNPELSRAEILSYLISRNINYKIFYFEQNYLAISFEDEINLDIQRFGGVLKIGKIEKTDSERELEIMVEKYITPFDKFKYSIIGNLERENYFYLEELLKEKFRKEKTKAQIRHRYDRIKNQEGEEYEIINSDVEFLFFKINNKKYFGVVEQIYSYEEIKNRDMGKPVRRESLAISPRLSKILINLSQVKEGEYLLDPFCGIGGVIMESLAMKINCYGVDIDEKAISGTRRNLDWLKKNYKINNEYILFKSDSRKIPNIKINGVASESSLGELVRKKLNDSDAKVFIKKFEENIIPILKRIGEIKPKKSKIAITFPFIRNISVNLELVQEKTGLKIYKLDSVKFPIKEFRERQFVGREIVVLE